LREEGGGGGRKRMSATVDEINGWYHYQ